MSSADADCVFCRLMRGELEVSTVHEDKYTVVFGLRLPIDYRIRPRAELDEAADALRRVWA